MVDVAAKPELDFIEPIIEQLVEAYLDPTHNFAWFVANSNGKDSSTVSYCVWKAVERIPVEARTRMVYFATTDTLLEHPHMRELMDFSYKNMNEVAKGTGLPIEAFLVKPKMTAVMKMLAHGNPLPTPKSSLNRWCTDLLKLRPMEELQEKLIEKHGGIILMLGVRSDESKKRANSIKKHSIEGEFIFPKVGAKETANGFYEKYMSHPIVDLNDEEVWRTITYARILPWRTKATTIRKMYEGAGECPIQVDRQSSKPCGGSSRNGCMICMMTTSEDDKMLQSFIDKGEDWAVHMNRLRRLIRESLFDARFRRPINAWRKKKMDWVNPFVQNYDQKEEEWKAAKGKKATREAFLDQFKKEQDFIAERSEGIGLDSKPVYEKLSFGGYNLQARIFLLKAFLHTQKVSGVTLVSDDELAYVKRVWTEECGWVENEEDLEPVFPEYSGSLVLNPDYTVNVEDTTLPNLTLYSNVLDEQTMYGMVIPNIENKKLTPPPRKRSKMTKAEELAMMTAPTPKTINLNPSISERHEAFYIEMDWTESETEIVAHLERSGLKSKSHIPYYWFPQTMTEKKMDWNVMDVRDHIRFWNIVVFIVCDPTIKSREDAIRHVENYIDMGLQSYGNDGYATGYLEKLESLQDDRNHWREQYMEQYKGKTAFVVRREMLQNAEDPDCVPLDLMDYACVSKEELFVARVMRYNSANPILVQEHCKGHVWNEVGVSLIEGMKPHEAKLFLLYHGYTPNVLPKSVKDYSEVGDQNLIKANKLLRSGVRGKEFWKQFHLCYLAKGMSSKELSIFLVKHDFTSSDIPKVLRRFIAVDNSMLSFAMWLKKVGMPIDKIEQMFSREDWQKIESVDDEMVQLEFDLGA